jgi:probable rRNA maturation factor
LADASPIEIDLAHPSFRIDTEALEPLIWNVVAGEGAEAVYVGVILADHETVLDLNRTYLQHDYLTDVLSFDLSETEDASVVEGEVYVDLDTAFERHEEFGVSFEEEVRRYVVHGLLHLLGYDDGTPEGKAAMHALEDKYLGVEG